jgi:hypothetical protein
MMASSAKEFTARLLAEALNWKTWEWETLQNEIHEEIKQAIAVGDESSAKSLRALKIAGTSLSQYIKSFCLMKDGVYYYDAWCLLKKSEINTNHARQHCTDPQVLNLLSVVESLVVEFQKLFPYRLFGSPAYIIKQTQCSICGETQGPRSRCGHKPGEIYSGELCYQIITDAEPTEFSFVEKPAQKYSVPGCVPGKTDHYDYSVLRFVIKNIQSPFLQK